jgi:serine protease inhibitor
MKPLIFLVLILRFQSLYGQQNSTVNFANDLGFKTLQALSKGNEKPDLLINPVGLYGISRFVYKTLDEAEKQKFCEFFNLEKGDSLFSDGGKKLRNASIGDAEIISSSILQSLWLKKGFVSDTSIDDLLRSTEFMIDSIQVSNSKQGLNNIDEWLSKTPFTVRNFFGKPGNQNIDAISINVNQFSGSWLQQFDINKRNRGTFYNSSNFEVTYMHASGYFFVGGSQYFDLLIIPLEDPRFSCFVYVPVPTFTLNEMISEINYTDLLQPLNKIHKEYFNWVQLPMLKMAYEFNVAKLFFDMGIMEPGKATGLNNQTATLPPSQMIQCSSIMMDEKGGTLKENLSTPMHRTNNVFQVDRPFLFAIVNEEIMSLVYLGKMTNLE